MEEVQVTPAVRPLLIVGIHRMNTIILIHTCAYLTL